MDPPKEELLESGPRIRTDDHEVRLHALAEDAGQHACLLLIRFHREDEGGMCLAGAHDFTMNTTSTAPTTAKTSSGAFSML